MTGDEVALAGDHHVHSTYSTDARGTVAENIAVAVARGVRDLVLADHVRADTTWVTEYRGTVGRCADEARADLRVHCGVETKLLDRTGRLDLPDRLGPVDRVLIADHQYPGPTGPWTPTEVRYRLDRGDLTAADVVGELVGATAAAMYTVDNPQLAHLFSLLPKVGLTEAAVGADHLDTLAAAARATGAVVEVNEKWQCPGPAAVATFVAAGVPVVASTDSHRAEDIALYDWVADVLPAPR